MLYHIKNIPTQRYFPNVPLLVNFCPQGYDCAQGCSAQLGRPYTEDCVMVKVRLYRAHVGLYYTYIVYIYYTYYIYYIYYRQINIVHVLHYVHYYTCMYYIYYIYYVLILLINIIHIHYYTYSGIAALSSVNYSLTFRRNSRNVCNVGTIT